MKYFITGGSGFMGLHFLDNLLKLGNEVVVYDMAPLDETIAKHPRVSYVQGDVRDTAKMTEAMRGCDVAYHNAAVLPISRSGKAFWEINVGGTKACLEAALANKVKKVLVISTSSVYGIPKQLPITEQTPLTPLGEYGFSKLESEKTAQTFRQEHDLDVSVVRPRTLVGVGRLGIFGILFDWIKAGKRIYIIGKGDNLFQLLSAADLAEACRLMSLKPCKNEDFVLGADDYGTVRGDMEALIKHAGSGSRVRPTNAFIVRNILAVVDWMKISPLVDWHYKTPHKPFYFDTTKAKTMLGWQPLDSNVSMLTDTYDWYLRNQDTLKGTGTTHRKNVKQGILKLLKALS